MENRKTLKASVQFRTTPALFLAVDAIQKLGTPKQDIFNQVMGRALLAHYGSRSKEIEDLLTEHLVEYNEIVSSKKPSSVQRFKQELAEKQVNPEEKEDDDDDEEEIEEPS